MSLDLRFSEQVMNLEVFGEIVISFGNYIPTVGVCCLSLPGVQNNSIYWFTPADLQIGRAPIF
jgi:hypothetical protein